MKQTARDLILELYKQDHITKEETNLLLDVEKASVVPYIDCTYRSPTSINYEGSSNSTNLTEKLNVKGKICGINI